jgi:AraC-like DNA-binding protein
LHRGFYERGFSIEWHEFRVERDFDWARSFHSESLEICLNFSGSAQMHDGAAGQVLADNEIAIYATQKQRIRAVRDPAGIHRFITLEVSRKFLEDQFSDVLTGIKKPVREFMDRREGRRPFMDRQALPTSLLASRHSMIEPPVSAIARAPWYLGRALEVLSLTMFAEEKADKLFCQRHRQLNRDRIEHVCGLIHRDLENPPSLEMLAVAANCSSFYLSRLFAKEMGVSIPKFLRMKRIEKAASLIASGALNVTDAAMAVGYSSLSAFNKAFVEQLGCCPGLYQNVRQKCALKFSHGSNTD